MCFRLSRLVRGFYSIARTIMQSVWWEYNSFDDSLYLQLLQKLRNRLVDLNCQYPMICIIGRWSRICRKNKITRKLIFLCFKLLEVIDVKLLGKYIWKLILISVLSYYKARYDLDFKVLEKHVGKLIFILISS